jgi:hypothetical protein
VSQRLNEQSILKVARGTLAGVERCRSRCDLVFAMTSSKAGGAVGGGGSGGGGGGSNK